MKLKLPSHSYPLTKIQIQAGEKSGSQTVDANVHKEVEVDEDGLIKVTAQAMCQGELVGEVNVLYEALKLVPDHGDDELTDAKLDEFMDSELGVEFEKD